MAEFAAVGTNASSDREITLTSKDGEEFKVSLKIAKLSGLISSMITEEDDDENTIPLPNVEGSDLARVLQFCSQYVKEPMTEFQKVFLLIRVRYHIFLIYFAAVCSFNCNS